MENMEYYTQRLQCSDEEKDACLETVVKLYHLRWYLRKWIPGGGGSGGKGRGRFLPRGSP